MNREIKFRCWTGRMMEEWNHIKTWESLGHHLGTQTEFKWMQYTGLHDKNGKEIYEGDVIRDMLGNTWTISFSNGAFRVNNGMPLGSVRSLFEVIGNVFQNPELLSPENKTLINQ